MSIEINPNWWKEMSVYQIWPRSFADGNNDGIGDLHGVLAKLDYIKALGVDAIWFSPLYPSPNCDYGYDCADYKNIHPEYGDLDLFKQVLDGAHARGIKVILDLVINHTSDEHEWFKLSKEQPESEYHDYYYWRKGKKPGGKKPPNNWLSVFEGKAWEYNKDLDEYYLHVFAKGQPDLNVSNPKVREEIKSILRFWLEMGVDGFREDVITYIAKREGLPNGFPLLPIGRGMEHWTSLPPVKGYLREFQDEVLTPYGGFTVGEAPGMTPKLAKEYITSQDGKRPLLDLMFHFQHMEADCFMTDFIGLPFSLKKLKKAFSAWQREMFGVGWNALYIENHDHPRIINRYGSLRYREASGKMLAAMYLLQSGTPFIYQGQEIGMTNITLDRLDQFKDVATFNVYNLVKKFGMKEERFVKLANRKSREHARTPVQWKDAPHGGFSVCGAPDESADSLGYQPWFPVNPNYNEINVDAAEADPYSILHWYRAILQFRKENPLVIYGSYQEHYKSSRSLYVYSREHEGKKLLVICAFGEKPVQFCAPRGFDLAQGRQVFGNYAVPDTQTNSFVTKPWECRVYHWDE